MKPRYPTSTFIPEPTGQVITVTSKDTELLRLMFGDQADKMAEVLKRAEERTERRTQ